MADEPRCPTCGGPLTGPGGGAMQVPHAEGERCSRCLTGHSDTWLDPDLGEPDWWGGRYFKRVSDALFKRFTGD